MKCLWLYKRVQKHVFDISGTEFVGGGMTVTPHFIVKQSSALQNLRKDDTTVDEAEFNFISEIHGRIDYYTTNSASKCRWNF